MTAFTTYVHGLAVAHLAWFWFWVVGSLTHRRLPKRTLGEEALLDIVVDSINGIALTGLASFALGVLGVLRIESAAAAAVLVIFVLVRRRESPFGMTFWTVRWQQLATAASPGLFIVYAVSLALALPAIVPDNGSDATAFYLPQALEYAQTHHLVVDPWYRFPWYPNNWVLIETWPFVFGLGALGQFISWLCGCLTLLGIYGLTILGAQRYAGRSGMHAVRAIGVAATLCLALCGSFIKVLDIGMIDVPSSMLFLGVVIGATLGVREPRDRLIGLVGCGGFLVGVKISFVLLLPFFAGLCWMVAARFAQPRRTFAVALVALTVISAPWYIRAFVLAGDPITPVLNLRFQGVDPSFDRRDYAAQAADLRSDTSPRELLRLPWQLFADFKAPDVRDFGITLVAILIPLPLFYLGWAIVSRRSLRASPLLTIAVSCTYGYAYWNLTSHLGRYVLLFLPCVIAFVAISLSALSARSILLRYGAAAVMFLLAYPSTASRAETLGIYWSLEMAGVWSLYTNADTWLEQRSPAYPQLEDVAHRLKVQNRSDLRVYIVDLGGARLFARQFGMIPMGDPFGLQRYRDLSRAIIDDDLQSYVDRLHIGVFIVPEYALTASPEFAGFTEAMQSMHWNMTRYPASIWIVFTAPVLSSLAVGEGKPAP